MYPMYVECVALSIGVRLEQCCSCGRCDSQVCEQVLACRQCLYMRGLFAFVVRRPLQSPIVELWTCGVEVTEVTCAWS